MKKIFFRRSGFLFSLAFLLVSGIGFACADDWFDVNYFSNFAPEVSDLDESYRPLYLSDDLFYEVQYDNNHVSRFNDAIVSDWSTYMGNRISKNDLSFFLLEPRAGQDIGQLNLLISKGQQSPKWSKKINLQDEKVKNFLVFLKLAKKIEAKTTSSVDPWAYEPVNLPRVDEASIIQVEQKFKETSEPFLKNRYWFQTVKAKFYSANKSRAIEFFERTSTQMPKNALYYRAVGYVAGAYYKQKNFIRANYLYALVFNNCPEMRTVAAYNFHPQEEADFNASLKLTKDLQEKIGLWSLFGYYADEKAAIREIYRLDPKSKHLELLLVRLINKEENKLNAEEFKEIHAYKQYLKENLSKECVDLITRIATEEKTGNPRLWNVSAAYLNILAGKNTEADRLLSKDQNTNDRSSLFDNQVRLLRLINSLFSIPKIDPVAEEKLLPELTWLYKECPVLEIKNFRYQHASRWSRQYLSAVYKDQGNIIFQELFGPENTFYQEQTRTDQMKGLLTKPQKTAWEQMAIDQYPLKLADIYEYEGIMSTYREGRTIDKALRLMEMTQNSSDTLPGNPFIGNIQDCHDCDHAQVQNVKYSKLRFLQKIKEHQTNIESGKDLYQNLLLLGHAFYNISYFGNARRFYNNPIVGQYSNYIDPYYQASLYNSSIAREYYQKALSFCPSNEERARCYYLIAKCDRNDFYTNKYHSKADYYGYDEQQVDFLEWDGFKQLKYEYADTKFYQEAIKECGYFRTYVQKNR